jgi:hypothetical protein
VKIRVLRVKTVPIGFRVPISLAKPLCFTLKLSNSTANPRATHCVSAPWHLNPETFNLEPFPMLAANAFLKINREKVRHALAANNPVCPDSARLSADAGLPHKARRAEDHGPAIDRWVRMPHWLKSRQGRKNPAFPRRYFPVLSWTFFKENPRNITFLHLETTPHHHHRTINNPRGGRARHSVHAAIGIQADKLSPTAAIPMLNT